MFVLDDLQWCDASTVSLVSEVIMNLGQDGDDDDDDDDGGGRELSTAAPGGKHHRLVRCSSCYALECIETMM